MFSRMAIKYRPMIGLLLILFALNVQVFDTPNDDGTSITIKLPWKTGKYRSFAIYRGKSPDNLKLVQDFVVGEVYKDRGLEPGKEYYYKIVAYTKDGGKEETEVIGPVKTVATWFNSNRLGILVAIILLGGLFVYFVEKARKGEDLFIRKISGLEAIDDAVGRAAELGKPIVYIPGLLGINSIPTIASLSILRRVAKKAAEYEVDLIMPNADPMVMTTAQEVVKEAYMDAGRPDLYNPNNIYYLTSDQFGYTAGVDGILMREKPGAVFLQGYFYAESLILAETAYSIGAIQIAGTTSTTQLPFFVAACDYTLIGEEMLAASAYLSKDPVTLGSLKAEDYAKAFIIVFLVVAILSKFFGFFDFSKLLIAK